MRYDKKTLSDVRFDNKTVIVRLDLNVPIRDGVITNDKRIVAALDTLRYLINNNAKIVVLSHLGRIKSLDDVKNGKKSLRLVAEKLQTYLRGTNVIFCEENTGDKVVKAVKALKPREILLLENTRYNDVDSKGNLVKLESKNDAKLAKFWASLGDIFVNDAFGTAHRAHASNVGIASNIKESCIGLLIEKELNMLSKACDEPRKPLIAILGGNKVVDKIKTIDEIAKNADKILIGGAMAYSFEKALGHKVGKSLVDDESVKVAKTIIQKYKDIIALPVDTVYAAEISQSSKAHNIDVDNDSFDQSLEGLDIGKKTVKLFKSYLKNAATVIWNGPLGYTELPKFAKGTKKICKAIAKLGNKGAFTLIGGGDSAAAAINLGCENKFSHISTGGGASLAYFENSVLPGIQCIDEKPKQNVAKSESENYSQVKESKIQDKQKSNISNKKEYIVEVEEIQIDNNQIEIIDSELDIIVEEPKNNKKPSSKKTNKKTPHKKQDTKKAQSINKKSSPAKKTNTSISSGDLVISSDLEPYDFWKRRKIWKNKATLDKEHGYNCDWCNEHRRKAIHTDKKEDICYFCLIHKPDANSEPVVVKKTTQTKKSETSKKTMQTKKTQTSKKTIVEKKESTKKPIAEDSIPVRSHVIVKNSELEPYDYWKRRDIWKAKAGTDENKPNCNMCNKAKRRSILTDSKKHICYFCLIKNPNK